ncbi:flagellar FliJ protein [Natranaerovirga hydrolytica]|uniref:Flagellar FliJ protein n=1 Tax=Natranaerovirga hydrolytica TaxID=680378 RepID=A0A4V6NFI1_9FIRM|nr:flagellar export protein FliJ [Natranaerovirga hydrolytica]TCK97891.1 flagellar FliJ protein [Natranaerovirga hydrolytica]
MARFNYKLQNILDIKNKMEEQKKISYSEASREYSIQEEKVFGLHEKRNQYENRFKSSVNVSMRATELKTFYSEIECIKDFCKKEEKKLKQSENKLEDARIKMNEAMIERKTYEKLKEKSFENFILEENKKESKSLDELISYKYSKPQQ